MLMIFPINQFVRGKNPFLNVSDDLLPDLKLSTDLQNKTTSQTVAENPNVLHSA